LNRKQGFADGALRLGRVSSYDRRRGLGVVIDAGGNAFDFHATAIADGTRAIDQDVKVAFTVVAGHRGRYEAQGLTVIEPSVPG
jgi:cold shock CspA family protein